MANYATLISAIQTVITENGNNEITGQLLQQALISIINALGSGYQYLGVANPDTNPGTPDQRVFYLAAPGVYPNFGPATIDGNQIGVFKYSSNWTVELLQFPMADGSVTTQKLADRSVTIDKLALSVVNLINEITLGISDDADLDITDQVGHILVRFYNGHIKVKNFDSSQTATSSKNGLMSNTDKAKLDSVTDALQVGELGDYDFAIMDNNGNAIVIFYNGHIKVKNFDSSMLALSEFFKNKKVSILGDSISTAQNNNAVEFTVLASDISQHRTLYGYPTYYDIGTTIGGVTVTSAMVGVLTSFTPVSGDVGKTIGKALNYNTIAQSNIWWSKTLSKLGAFLLQNVSWSGSSISSHEGETQNLKTSYAWHPAQINKLSTRDANGNAITPDVVIIYRGTNDFSHTPYAKLTDFDASAMSIPNTDVITDGFGFKEGYCRTIQNIREKYPMARIVCCTLNVFKRVNYSNFPTNNGTVTLPQYNNAIREIANQMGCAIIEFDKDGITFENCYPTYISDSATIPTHPNATGHSIMADKAIVDLSKQF